MENIKKLMELVDTYHRILKEEIPSRCPHTLYRLYKQEGVEGLPSEFNVASDCKVFSGMVGLEEIYRSVMYFTKDEREQIEKSIENSRNQMIGLLLIDIDHLYRELKRIYNQGLEISKQISPQELDKLKSPGYCREIEGGCTRLGRWYVDALETIEEIKRRLEEKYRDL